MMHLDCTVVKYTRRVYRWGIWFKKNQTSIEYLRVILESIHLNYQVFKSKGLSELYTFYESKKVDKYYLIVVGFSMFKTDKYYNNLYYKVIPQ
jgi:hypothetical protein